MVTFTPMKLRGPIFTPPDTTTWEAMNTSSAMSL